MSDFEHILLDLQGDGDDHGIATITLNRPEAMNAFTNVMVREMVAAFDITDADDSVRSVIVTGAGRAFCAGADLSGGADTFNASEQPDRVASDNTTRVPRDGGGRVTTRIFESRKPVIGAINGHAVGVGMTMVMPCDIRVAAEEAKLGFIFGRLGILPGLGTTHLLPRLVGMAKAQELVLTAGKIKGPEALEIGLVNRCVPAADVLATTQAMAREMAEIDPIVLRHAKAALYYGGSHSMAEAMKNEQRQSAVLKAERDAAKAGQ